MKPEIFVTIRVGALQSMTTPQFEALRENVLREGNWETANGIIVTGGGDHLGVQPISPNGAPMIYIGIEPDGYTHS